MKSTALGMTLMLLLLVGCGPGGSDPDDLRRIRQSQLINRNVTRELSRSPHCCDPSSTSAHEIGVLGIRNEFKYRPVKVKIGPFDNGVVTADGAFTEVELKPGEQTSRKLYAPHCNWESAKGLLHMEVVEHVDRELHLYDHKIELAQSCTPQTSALTTGIVVEGIAPAYFNDDPDNPGDAPPVGKDPWLYVTGIKGGVEAYAITRDAAGRIAGTKRVDAASIPRTGGSDLVPASAETGGKRTHAVFIYDPNLWARSHWAGTAFGGIAHGGGVKDLVSYGGISRSSGVSYTNGSVVRFDEYDPAGHHYSQLARAKALSFMNWKKATGDPVSAIVHPRTRAALVLTNGSPGQVWFHDRKDYLAGASLVARTGNDPRKIRAKNGLAVVTNYASSSVTLLLWNGGGVGAPVDLSTVANPHHLDMAVLANGNTLLVVASATQSRYEVFEIARNGALVRSEKKTANASGISDIAILPGKRGYIAIAHKGLREVALVETAFHVRSGS